MLHGNICYTVKHVTCYHMLSVVKCHIVSCYMVVYVEWF